jgi:hypothetical protein
VHVVSVNAVTSSITGTNNVAKKQFERLDFRFYPQKYQPNGNLIARA